ncbi:unnamed protein product, partial [Hymenolepis diminuta]
MSEITASSASAEQGGIKYKAGGYLEPEPIDMRTSTESISSAIHFSLSESDVNSELSSKNSKSFACDICKKSYSQKRYLKIHVMAIHENIRPFKCPKCEKSFPTAHLLKIHIKFFHES